MHDAKGVDGKRLPCPVMLLLRLVSRVVFPIPLMTTVWNTLMHSVHASVLLESHVHVFDVVLTESGVHPCRACERLQKPAAPLPVPKSLPVPNQASQLGASLDQLNICQLPRRADGSLVDWAGSMLESWDCSESAALDLLENFVASGGLLPTNFHYCKSGLPIVLQDSYALFGGTAVT